MTWYTGHYGSWNDAGGVKRIDGTYSRKEMFEKARKIANELQVTVTIIAERGSCQGIMMKAYKVKAE